jgi:hypothetical protein
MRLYNAKFQYAGLGLFRFQFLFENEYGTKADGVTSSLGSTIRVGDTKEIVAQKLRDMADELEG